MSCFDTGMQYDEPGVRKIRPMTGVIRRGEPVYPVHLSFILISKFPEQLTGYTRRLITQFNKRAQDQSMSTFHI